MADKHRQEDSTGPFRSFPGSWRHCMVVPCVDEEVIVVAGVANILAIFTGTHAPWTKPSTHPKPEAIEGLT